MNLQENQLFAGRYRLIRGLARDEQPDTFTPDPNATVSQQAVKKDVGATVPMPDRPSPEKAPVEAGHNNVKKSRIILFAALVLGAILIAVLLCTGNSGKRAAKQAYPEYSSLVSRTTSALYKPLGADAIDSIRNSINYLKSIESTHSGKDARFHEAASLEQLLSSKVQAAFDSYVSAAEDTKANDVKADNYYNALRIKEDTDIREKYNALADKLNGIKRVDFVMIYRDDDNETYADRIDYRLEDGKLVKDPDAKPLVASKVTYMDLYFEFQDFEGAEKKYNKQTFYVKIFQPNGTLMTGQGSPSGYTYTASIDLGEDREEWEGHCVDSPKVWCYGWGNNNKTAYKAGTYKVQVYHKGRLLFSVPVTYK